MGPHLFVWYVLIALMMNVYLLVGGTWLGFGLWYLFAPYRERKYLFQALRPQNNGSSLWLVLVSSALYFLFPRVFRILFSGFYPVIAVIFIVLGFRILALILRDRFESSFLNSVWDVCISLGNVVPLFLLGLIAGYILKGVPLYAVGRFNVNVLGYVNHYTVVSGLLTVCACAVLSFTAIAWNSDGKTRAYARFCSFNTSLLMFLLIFDLGLWSFHLSPYITKSLSANPVLLIVPVCTVIAAISLPLCISKRRFKLSYVIAAFVMIGLVTTFFLTIYPHLRLIFSRTNIVPSSMNLNRPNFGGRRNVFRQMIEERKTYLPVYIFLMAATAFLQIRLFRLHHRFTHCPLPYDEEDDELM